MPKFGNWESEENVPYTAYFEKARKGRGGKIINPNDPQENLDSVSIWGFSINGLVARFCSCFVCSRLLTASRTIH